MNTLSDYILQQAGVKTSYFSPTSRYFGIEVVVHETGTGNPIPHIKRRFLPSPDRFQTIQEHSVNEGERPDTITHQYLSDPEQFWRICDANGVMHPNELTESIGKKVRITLPEGIIPL